MKKVYPYLFILALWQFSSTMIDRSVILPCPIEVLHSMYNYLINPLFYLSLFYTCIRIITSLCISLILSITLSFISYFNKTCNDIITPMMSLLQTIPQISYIIILLVWFSNRIALFIIICMMLIPIIYMNTLHGLLSIDDDLKDVITLYHHSIFFNVRYVYLPLIKHSLYASLDACIPLSIKVAVMSEIFVSSSFGIGKLLYISRINIDMASIFALTIYMIIIIQILLKIYRILSKQH